MLKNSVKFRTFFLGMFMVCADFRGKSGKLITMSCRSAMLHYRSYLLQAITTIFYSPLYIIGTFEEKQSLSIELFADYNENEVNWAYQKVYKYL